jgi:hypothetical protein
MAAPTPPVQTPTVQISPTVVVTPSPNVKSPSMPPPSKTNGVRLWLSPVVVVLIFVILVL